MSMQVKLLRVLQEREVMRVGGSSIVQVDVRIVAATNESLEEKVEDGSFRRDLYYRLNALTVVIPPLCERGQDVFKLLEHFKQQLGGSFELAEETKEFLLNYSWPGNIRELHNTVEYFNYMGKTVIGIEDLPPAIARMNAQGIFRKAQTRENKIYSHRDKEGETFEKESKLPEKRKIPYETKKQSLYWFVLEQIYLAGENGQSIGREKLLQTAGECDIQVSQKQVRDLIQRLFEEGMIVKGRGKRRKTADLQGKAVFSGI